MTVVGAVALLWLADVYPALRFRGDARFSGGPVFGYWIHTRPIPFDRPGEYIFHFRGMPNEEMSLQLYAEGKGGENRSELTNLSTQLEALLVNQSGRVMCHAAGIVPIEMDEPCDDSKPSKVSTDEEIRARGQNEWVLMSGPNEAAYWHENCLRVHLKPPESYTLTLRIRAVDAKTPHINLIPTLEGGQLDLP